MKIAIVGATLLGCQPPHESSVLDASADSSTTPDSPEDAAMWTTVFDGTLTSEWRMSTIQNQPGHDDPGEFLVQDGALVPRLGNDLGLLWYTPPVPPDFELVLEFRQQDISSNSGVFVRFPDLESKGYNNTSFVAVDFGFEIQIDGTGAPDGADWHKTGAVYNEHVQEFSLVPARPAGEWNEYRIWAVGQVYTVVLNGSQTTRFVNTRTDRGVANAAHIGLQVHAGDGHVAFRNVRIRAR